MNNSILKQFGQSLKKIRKQQGLSQEALANLANLDRTYISFLEGGKRNPSLLCINTIRTVLGVSFSQLLDGENTLNEKDE